MRTDSLKAAALALVVAASVGWGGALAAQDSLVLEPALTAPGAVELRRGGDVLRINGDHTIPAGTVVDGDVVVLNGTLRVDGEVRGSVTVSRGELRLEEGAVVRGDAVVTAGRLVNRGAVVGGEMRVTDAARAANSHAGGATTRVRAGRGWLTPLGTGVTGLMNTLAFGLLLSGVGVAMIYYARPQLGRVSDTVRGEGLRAAGVGLAVNILALPAFVLGVIALVLTVVGILLLPLYIPLFWVAVLTAGAVGIVGVAHALGERTAEQREGYGAAGQNAYTYLFHGLVLLLAPLVASHLLHMTGVLGFVGDVVWLVAWMGLWIAASVGAGAVLLTVTRAWRERRYRRIMEMAPPEMEADRAG